MTDKNAQQALEALKDALARIDAAGDPTRLTPDALTAILKDYGMVQSWCNADGLRKLLAALESAAPSAAEPVNGWFIVENTGTHGHEPGFYAYRETEFDGREWFKQNRAMHPFSSRAALVSALEKGAPPAPSATSAEPTVMDEKVERKAAEQHYVKSAFNYPEAPVGSRDWCLFWDEWQARATLPAVQPEAETSAELPKPYVLELDTPGADSDITYVDSMELARDMLGGYEGDDAWKQLVKPLFTAEQMAAYRGAPAETSAEKADDPANFNWANAGTVGKLAAMLKTLDPDAPIFAAYYVTLADGRRLCKAKGLTISRERVKDGMVDPSFDVPYSLVLWSSQADAPMAEPVVLTDERIDDLLVDVLGFGALEPESRDLGREIARIIESELRARPPAPEEGKDAARKPLTDDQIFEALKANAMAANGGTMEGLEFSREMFSEILKVCRVVERAHGITDAAMAQGES